MRFNFKETKFYKKYLKKFSKLLVLFDIMPSTIQEIIGKSKDYIARFFKVILDKVSKILLFILKVLKKLKSYLAILKKNLDKLKKRLGLTYKLIPVKLLLSYTSILIINLILVLILYLNLMEIPGYIYTLNLDNYFSPLIEETIPKFNKFLEYQEDSNNFQIDLLFAEVRKEDLFPNCAVDIRPKYLILEGWLEAEGKPEKVRFMLKFFNELILSNFFGRTFLVYDSFIDNFFQSFFKEGEKSFFEICEDRFYACFPLHDYMHSVSPKNKLIFLADNERVRFEARDCKWRKISLVEDNIRTLSDFFKGYEEDLKKLIRVEKKNYGVLKSQNFIFIYKYKILIYALILIHMILGGLNFIYDYCFKRMEEDCIKSLWTVYFSLALIVVYIIIHYCLNLPNDIFIFI